MTSRCSILVLQGNAMRSTTIAHRITDISDADLIGLALEPEFLEDRTALELELLARLEMALVETRAMKSDISRLLEALWQSH